MTREQLREWRGAKREFLSADAVPLPPPVEGGPSTADDDTRRVDVCWYTGVDVPRIDWMTGDIYMLRFDPGGEDLSVLNSGAPILDDHMSFGGACNSQKGKVKRAWKADSGNYLATLQFSRRPDCDGLWMDIRDGVVAKFSMGVALLETDEVRDKGGKLLSITATKWQPFEISIEPIPADFATTTLSRDTPAEPLANEAPRATAQIKKEVPIMPELNNPTGVDARLNDEQLQAARDEGARMEREKMQREQARLSGIDQACAAFLKRGNIDEAFVVNAKTTGMTPEQAKLSIIDQLARETDVAPIHGSHGASVTKEAREKLREGMEAALLYRANPADPKLEVSGRDFAGLTLVDMGRECLQEAGVKTRGMSRMDIAEQALKGRVNSEEFLGGMATTSDFPNILANVANKSLRTAYSAAPRTYIPFCRMVTASDFKPINRVQLSEIAALQKVNSKGEFHRTYLSDSKETYSLVTYGNIVSITRQVVVNDDLQALTRIPAGFGMAAATLESDTVWGVITGNAAMADTYALFLLAHHANLKASNALSAVANVSAARLQMRLQTGPKGTPLNLTPKYLIVPAALETVAFQLTNPINLAATASASDVPAFVRSMVPIVEPRLDAVATVGATNWYTAADPNESNIDTIEYCYLEGQQGVYIETRNGFDVDGVEIKARLDFAAAAIDYRGLQKNTSGA
jgi:hypothetical protein